MIPQPVLNVNGNVTLSVNHSLLDWILELASFVLTGLKGIEQTRLDPEMVDKDLVRQDHGESSMQVEYTCKSSFDKPSYLSRRSLTFLTSLLYSSSSTGFPLMLS